MRRYFASWGGASPIETLVGDMTGLILLDPPVLTAVLAVIMQHSEQEIGHNKVTISIHPN